MSIRTSGVWARGSAVAVVLLALCGAASQRVSAQPITLTARQLPPVGVDNDHDGIDDALEQLLAEKFAPVIYMEPGESNYPVNVDWLLARQHLWYGEQGCTPDENEHFFGPVGSQDLLLGPNGAAGDPWIHPFSFGANHHMTHCSSDDARPLSTTEPLPEHFGDDQLWFLADSSGNDAGGSYRLGSLDPHDWVTYFHAYPASDGGVMIQYWHTYSFNQFETFDAHGGDWDASIQVKLKPDLTLDRVYFSRHDDDHPGSSFTPDALRLFQDTHPVMTIDGGGHGAYHSPLDWATCDCTFLSDVTGAPGTIVWTNDSDPFDDPSLLRKAGFVCDPQNNCHLSLLDVSGGTIWKTWTDGDVRQSGGSHRIVTNPDPSTHGGLVNLGEYNSGVRQASQLLAGNFFPLNGQVFTKYSGRWGTTNNGASDGPRGPVFQGFDSGIYRSWYNQGGDFPADPNNSPWRQAPTTTLGVGAPSFHAANGATWISGRTPVTLSAMQTSLAEQYGSIVTSYRFFLVNAAPGSFSTYASPFNLTGADGTYAIQDFSLDGLNNAEAIQAQVFSFDATAPAATIAQPAAIEYVHSATLVLGYSVDDGAGSGVQSVTPTIDGALAVGGHGLASGQAIDLLTELSVGTHTFSVDASDNVANASTRSVAFSIVVTADSIKDDVAHFVQSGAITNAGAASSLLAKLDAAARKRAAGNCEAAANIYQAVINELQGQSGKGIDASAANIMIADAQYLIAHCP